MVAGEVLLECFCHSTLLSCGCCKQHIWFLLRNPDGRLLDFTTINHASRDKQVGGNDVIDVRCLRYVQRRTRNGLAQTRTNENCICDLIEAQTNLFRDAI